MRTRAWSGRLAAKVVHLDSHHYAPIGSKEGPALEIYAPVYETQSKRVIALAEIYISTPNLPAELKMAALGSWAAVGIVGLFIIALQLVVVRSGGRTIRQQESSLNQRVNQLSQLLQENQNLQNRANHANQRVAEMNDHNLRRIGSELHDGPVQLLSTARLRIDSLEKVLELAPKPILNEAHQDISALREALRESLEEIRHISAGLFPPDIEHLTVAKTLERAIRRHELWTDTTVTCEFGNLPENAPISVKSCFYRFVQEGLSNAFRHAGGVGQVVTAQVVDDQLEIAIKDEGPGISSIVPSEEHDGLGLMGLRARVESLGGVFYVGDRPLGGTCLKARVPFSPQHLEDEE
jgi:signal transduction histidine kinase